jgi:hypothetical protein
MVRRLRECRPVRGAWLASVAVVAALLVQAGPAVAQSDGCVDYYTPELVVDGRKVPYDLPQHRGAVPFEAAVGQTVAVDVQQIICPGDIFGRDADEASLEVVDEARSPALPRTRPRVRRLTPRSVRPARTARLR